MRNRGYISVALMALGMLAVGKPAHAQLCGPSLLADGRCPMSLTSDNSIAYSSGRISVSGLNNVLADAPGIAINDGSPHTIANAPIGSPFYGLTTLAQVAAITIDGKKPFWFLVDPGVITGAMCSYSSTTNCFTDPNGYYKLTDAMVPNMSITWLAMQATMLTRAVYVPAALSSASPETGYEVDRPLMMPLTQSTGQQTFKMAGDGTGSSVIQPTQDFGQLSDNFTDLALIMGGDPAATSVNKLGRWVPANGMVQGIIQDIGLWGDSGKSPGVNSTYKTDGITFVARLAVNNVTVSYFHHDGVFMGDHTLYVLLSLNSGYATMYWS
ncbi:MAG: hypothetical protein ACRYGR_06020, partial [Janthinobacterium lividum]